MLLTPTNVVESRWTLFLVSLVVVGMLALFHAIVSGATRAGELRRQAAAAQAVAVLRCNALPSLSRSKTCLKNLGMQESPDATIAYAGPIDNANAYPALQ